MSKVQSIIVLVFSFVVGISIINNLGIFQAPLPNQELTGFSEAKVNELQQSSNGMVSVAEEVSGIGMFLKALSFIWDAFVSLVYIIPLAQQYHVPLTIAAPMQALLTFIEGWFLVQVWLKFSTKNID